MAVILDRTSINASPVPILGSIVGADSILSVAGLADAGAIHSLLAFGRLSGWPDVWLLFPMFCSASFCSPIVSFSVGVILLKGSLALRFEISAGRGKRWSADWTSVGSW